MFVHVSRLSAIDPSLFRETFDRWRRDVGPVAAGWVGSVAGMSPHGAAWVSYWDDQDAFRTCSERREQSAFDMTSAEHLARVTTSISCPSVDLFLRGPRSDAGFVQVIFGRVTDESRARAVHSELEAPFGRHRPDVIGGALGWVGDGRFVETMYFTSQHDARIGEKTPLPEELSALEDEFASFIEGDLEFDDLREPWFAMP